MNDRQVNIVCEELDSDRILPRKARALAAETGWALQETPDASADVNYFIGYITFTHKFRNWQETPVAAYFTHKDTTRATKVRWWDTAAREVDLRCVSAELYARPLRLLGRTAIVRPPVDVQFTLPAAPVMNEIPIIGMSGFWEGSGRGRKGTHLVEQLLHSAVAKQCAFKAAGRGWPVSTEFYDWADMVAFYQSLDIYLCSSLIEGCPMPPLEALACGTAVVVPDGVGLMGELPTCPGIYHYAAGDYDGMERAVQRAIDYRHNVYPEKLATVASEYCAAHWAVDHEYAFSEFVPATTRITVPEIVPPRDGECGVYVVAYGEPARRCATQLLQSVREYLPNVPVAVASDVPLAGADFDVICEDVDIGGRYAKLHAYDLTPQEWRYVLYLDADMEIVADARVLFEFLRDGWEMLFTQAIARYGRMRETRRPDCYAEWETTVQELGTDNLVQLHGGVWGFRRTDAVARFFEVLWEEYERWGRRDSLALMRALYRQPVRLFVLSTRFNMPTNHCRYADSVIWHNHGQAQRAAPIAVRERWDSAAARSRI